MSAYPPDAICAEESCGHAYVQHEPFIGWCDGCPEHLQDHDFNPKRFAGGNYSPAAEQSAYERALRGE